VQQTAGELNRVNRFAQDLFRPLPQRYDRLEALLSLGQNERWRREMIEHVEAPAPATVLDVATGTAGVALALTRRTGAHVTGLDLTEPMLRQGQARVAGAGATGRVRLVAGQAERLPFPDAAFDALTFTYLLRYVDDPAATLAELARVLRPGGAIASLEFAVPSNRFWWPWWWLYTRAVLPVAGYVTGGREWGRVGYFLGPNISAHYERYPIGWTVRAWEDAGIERVGTRSMSLGGGLVMWGWKRAG
jgi:demethylmenaquinone methyltransferase / 2-methoxy-6-polyprenyl-1,4-benzoquinol methylase